MLQPITTLIIAFCAGLLEALLVLVAPASIIPGLGWAVPAGFCLTLAGTLAAHLTGLPRRAYASRALCGAVAGMLAQVFASVGTGTWRGLSDLAAPAWLPAVAPLLGALGALLGSLLEGVDMDFPARSPGAGTEEGA